LLRKKPNYLGFGCDIGEDNTDKERRVNLGGSKFEVNAEGEDHCMHFFLGSCALVDVFCPSCVDWEGLQLDDVAKGGKGIVTTNIVEMSDRSKDTQPGDNDVWPLLFVVKHQDGPSGRRYRN
jgi:hypothetical protein